MGKRKRSADVRDSDEDQAFQHTVDQQLARINEHTTYTPQMHSEHHRQQRRRGWREIAEKEHKLTGEHQIQAQIQSQVRKIPLDQSDTRNKGNSSHDSENQDDDDDMFSQSPVNELFEETGNTQITHSGTNLMEAADTWDDDDGYYRFRLGDVLVNRYEVYGDGGKGVFSTVLRVRDVLDGNRELILKIIRKGTAMTKTGIKEIEYLKEICSKDPENRMHIVRLYRSFEHRNHLCLVFEPMYLNLREVLKKFGDQGISLEGVRVYAEQLFIALLHLKSCSILHGDIKPDNILVDKEMKMIKLCDLGSAGRLDECEITPFLVSRFYRPPEVMIGLEYGAPVDVWSVGCVLYEIFTGRIMFSGKDNNEMLWLHMKLKGPFRRKMIRRGQFLSEHFDDNLQFERTSVDPVTGRQIRKLIVGVKVKRDIYAELRSTAGSLSPNQFKQLRYLGNLILKCLELNPSRRPTPEEALKHELFTKSYQDQ